LTVALVFRTRVSWPAPPRWRGGLRVVGEGVVAGQVERRLLGRGDRTGAGHDRRGGRARTLDVHDLGRAVDVLGPNVEVQVVDGQRTGARHHLGAQLDRGDIVRRGDQLQPLERLEDAGDVDLALGRVRVQDHGGVGPVAGLAGVDLAGDRTVGIGPDHLADGIEAALVHPDHHFAGDGVGSAVGRVGQPDVERDVEAAGVALVADVVVGGQLLERAHLNREDARDVAGLVAAAHRRWTEDHLGIGADGRIGFGDDREGPVEGGLGRHVRHAVGAVDHVVRVVDERPGVPDVVEDVPAVRRPGRAGARQLGIAGGNGGGIGLQAEVVGGEVGQGDIADHQALAVGEAEPDVHAALGRQRLELSKARDAIAAQLDDVAAGLEIQDGVGTIAGGDLEQVRPRPADQHVVAGQAVERRADGPRHDDVVEGVAGSGR
jgi:hypothetical protein